ncbi:MAG: GNVR domain-containing protein [Candidatus Acidiferrum sp.]
MLIEKHKSVGGSSMAVSSLARLITQLAAYWSVVVKYRWPCLIGTLALTLVFTTIIAMLPNLYEATTTILVDPQQVPEKYVSAVVSPDSYARLNTLTQQVLSRTRLQEVIDKFHLYSDRHNLSPEEKVEEMRRDISFDVKQGSGMELSTFSLTYQGKQPVTVAAVANELADSFIHWNIQSRDEQVSGTRDFLSAELMTARRNLERQENALRQFKMSHLGETPDQTPNNLVVMTGLRSALQANADAMNRLDEEKMLLTHSPEPTNSSTIPPAVPTERDLLEVQKRELEAKIEQLRLHYSDRYPDVIRATHRLEQIKSQLQALPPDTTGPTADVSAAKSDVPVRLAIIDKEMKKLEADRDRIQSQMESYQGKVDVAPLREQELLELSRNYDTSKQHYQALLDKSFNIAMAADLEQNQKAERFRVLDPARVPEKPVKPPRKKLIAASGILSFGLSLLILFVKEEVNPVVKTEMDLKPLLPSAVRIWGFVPRIEVTADTLRARRWAIGASVLCILLCVAIFGVIWQIHPL